MAGRVLNTGAASRPRALRGFGATRFLSNRTQRHGQQSIFRRRCLRAAGCDRDRASGGGRLRLGCAHRLHHGRAAAGAGEGAGLVSGYLTGSQAAGRTPLPPKAELSWWYQFYFATERGRLGYEANRKEFARLIGRHRRRRRLTISAKPPASDCPATFVHCSTLTEEAPNSPAKDNS
jgi:hypothetical protein